jgi:Uma2 family endonuclease
MFRLVEYIRPFPNFPKWELIAGRATMWPLPVERHQLIVSNVLFACDRTGRPAGYHAYPGLGVLNNDVDDYAPIPDVVVRCGPPVSGGYITDPILVAEVLSPSTAANDRGRKLEFYQTITSLRTILLVYPNERRVEHWTWTGNGWADGIAQGEGIVPLDGVGGEMTLAEVYEGLDS